MGNNVLYNQLGLLNLKIVFECSLFIKFLMLLLAGKLPEFCIILLSEPITPHAYKHPALVCEIERRGLSHQLIFLYESVPRIIFDINYESSLKAFRNSLKDNQ